MTMLLTVFVFQVESGILVAHWYLVFRRVLFQSLVLCPAAIGAPLLDIDDVAFVGRRDVRIVEEARDDQHRHRDREEAEQQLMRMALPQDQPQIAIRPKRRHETQNFHRPLDRPPAPDEPTPGGWGLSYSHSGRTYGRK